MSRALTPTKKARKGQCEWAMHNIFAEDHPQRPSLKTTAEDHHRRPPPKTTAGNISEERIRVTTETLLFHRVADHLSTSRKTSATLRSYARPIYFGFGQKPQPLVRQAQFRFSHPIKKNHSQTPPEAPTQPIPVSNEVDPISKTEPKPSTLLLILQRTALAYLLSISICLAWTGINGWYLVLNGRRDEVDERSPLRIVWDITRWPVDAARRLLKEAS